MGKEFEGIARVDGIAKAAKLHLDSTALQIRGGWRLTVPLAELRNASVAANRLRVESPHGPIEIELGAKRAENWRVAIASPKTLIEKLDLRSGDRVCIKNIDDASFHRDVSRAIGAAPANALRGVFDTIFLGVNNVGDLDAIASAADHLDAGGAIWLVYPKGKDSVVPESLVRRAFASLDLYDAKVAAFSTLLTAVKVKWRKVRASS